MSDDHDTWMLVAAFDIRLLIGHHPPPGPGDRGRWAGQRRDPDGDVGDVSRSGPDRGSAGG